MTDNIRDVFVLHITVVSDSNLDASYALNRAVEAIDGGEDASATIATSIDTARIVVKIDEETK